MKKIQDSAAFFFIIAIIILAVISILGVWDFFEEDVIWKSFQTIGLLAAVAVIVIIAGRFIDNKNTLNELDPALSLPNPSFSPIRHGTLVVLIVSVVLLALIGVMAIWDILSGSTMHKSLGSITIIAFSSFIIVVTCMERENHKLLRRGDKPMSVGKTILTVIISLWLLSWLGSILFGSMMMY